VWAFPPHTHPIALVLEVLLLPLSAAFVRVSPTFFVTVHPTFVRLLRLLPVRFGELGALDIRPSSR
jgi:hypothetical protein